MASAYPQLANFLRALSHPVRLQILDMLRSGEVCVCHIEAALHKRQAYISQQLMVLREEGIVGSRREGLQVYYWITDERIFPLLEMLLGEAQDKMSIIDGCPCPLCSTIYVIDIK